MTGGLRSVSLDFAEEAITLVRLAHADFSQLPGPIASRIFEASRITNSPSHDLAQIRYQSELVRMVTISEAFASTALEHAFNQRVSMLENFYVQLAQAAILRTEANWDSKKYALKTYFGINWADLAMSAHLDAAILARNAIAHGLGSLTSRQRSDGERKKVALLGAKIREDRVILTPTAIRNTLNSVVAVIEGIDAQLPRR